MNRYGTMARDHWEQWLPERYAAIRDPDSFFSTLGQEAEQQVEQLADQIAGDGQPGEEYLGRAGRMAAARSQAEEIVLPQMVLPDPDQDQAEPGQADQGRPAAVSPGHPQWANVDAEQRERMGLDG